MSSSTAAVRDRTALAADAAETPLARRQRLEGRLEAGWQRIDDARQRGIDVAAWERLWVQLLEEYERTCLDLEAMAAPASTSEKS